MKDYFEELKIYLNKKYRTNAPQISMCEMGRAEKILTFALDADVRYIYEHYKKFEISWYDDNDRYLGEIDFIPYDLLEKAHDDLIEMMNECYDAESDEFGIMQDIVSWYPLFYFPNGDAFCLDARDGKIVFYEHEVIDTGKNLHGLKIAESINDLFSKWSRIHFVDVYYWDEIVNEEGIDITSKLAKKYI